MFAEQRPVRVEVTLAVEGFFVASLPGVYAEVASSRADVQAPTVLSVLRLLRKVLQPLLMLEGMSGFWARTAQKLPASSLEQRAVLNGSRE
jgi:hypothetical protein